MSERREQKRGGEQQDGRRRGGKKAKAPHLLSRAYRFVGVLDARRSAVALLGGLSCHRTVASRDGAEFVQDAVLELPVDEEADEHHEAHDEALEFILGKERHYLRRVNTLQSDAVLQL